MRGLLSIFTIFVSLAPRPAAAQESDPAEEARAHDARAAELSEAGDHNGALMELGVAQELAPSTSRILVMARCQQARGNGEAAQSLYRLVTRADDATDEERVRATEAMEALAAAPDPGPGELQVEVIDATPAERAPGLAPTAFYAVLAFTLLSGAAYAVCAGLAWSTHEEFLTLYREDARAEQLRDQGMALSLGSNVALGVTSVAAVATIVLAIFTRFRDPEPPVALRPGPALRGTALAWDF